MANPDADAALATQFGIRSVQRVSLDELARDSDVVFVLAPGGEDTRHVVNEAFLRKMKKTGVLVNTSRGTLVDSDALAKALREEWIYAAGLDVVEGEPDVRVDHPLVKDPRQVLCSLIFRAAVCCSNVLGWGGVGVSFSPTLAAPRWRRGWGWPLWPPTISWRASMDSPCPRNFVCSCSSKSLIVVMKGFCSTK